MPDQPADPIHYEMKIPPEPKHPKKDEESDKAEAGGGDSESGGAADERATRKEDKQDGR